MIARLLIIDIDNSGSACYPIEAVVQGRCMRRARTWCCDKYRPQSGEEVRKQSMTVKIRLKRMGMKKTPSYRVVVADSRFPRDGRIIENLGWYNPLVEPSIIKINEEKALGWLKNGAQPSDSVAQLLKRTGLLERFEQTKAAAKSEAE